MSGNGDQKSLRHSLAALHRWQGTDPEARSQHMAELSRLSAEKRAADRAEREARGEVVAKPRRRTRSEDPMLPIADLLPVMADIQVERDAAGLSALSQESLMREASLRIRRAIADATYQALKDDR